MHRIIWNAIAVLCDSIYYMLWVCHYMLWFCHYMLWVCHYMLWFRHYTLFLYDNSSLLLSLFFIMITFLYDNSSLWWWGKISCSSVQSFGVFRVFCVFQFFRVYVISVHYMFPPCRKQCYSHQQKEFYYL